jgi:hypothetical protein
MSRTALLLGLLLAVVAETRAGVSVSVTTCGQVVPPGARAVLANDIACPPWGVCYPSCVPPNPGCFQPLHPVVTCRSTAECPDPPNDNCAFPPGTTASVGIYLGKGARLAMNSHSVSGAFIGIVSGNPQGTGAGKMQITGPGSIFGNQYGLQYASTLKVEGVSLHDNVHFAMWGSGRVTLEDVVGSDNGALAIAAKRMTARRVTATGNGTGLVSGGSLSVADSSITGSTVADIASVRRPHLRNVVCEKSLQIIPLQSTTAPPWGVCSND